MFEYMQEEKNLWEISDIYIITEDGKCTSANRVQINNDTVSEMVIDARANGDRSITIIRSTVVYTLLSPSDSTVIYNGSRIAAVSMVRDMSTLIDNLHFSSFDNKAVLYLTQSAGAKITQLTHEDAPNVYNVYSLIGDTAVYDNLH